MIRTANLRSVASWLRSWASAAVALILLSLPSAAAETAPASFHETPALAPLVEAGRLPPVSERVPARPRVIDPRDAGGTLGRHGGVMRWLMGKQKDLRMEVYYSYSRMICYDRDLKLVADILDRYEVEDGRIFTLHLRPGHKWSDGHPFTAEDFRYYWEDVATNKKIEKTKPSQMLVDGEEPVFEVIDETTVRYTWSKPNAKFLPGLAGTLPLVIALPAHYMKQFHPKYANAAELQARVDAAQVKDARALHRRMARITRAENPELPVLDPWYNATTPPSSLFVFRRNPYFHRVDPEGRQLPYIDRIIMAMGSTSLVPAKTGAGDSDLQARYLRFDDYTFLKAAEARGAIKVRLWDRANGSHIALMPNLNTKDETWRALMRDVRVRRAFSMAINREEINAAIFYGLARVSADTVLPQSPLYKPEYSQAWTRFDPEAANKLLDEAGLARRDSDGIRLLPDGRRAEIILESAGESTEEADVLSLIKDTWREIGIAIFPRPTQRDLFRQRASAGDTVMTVWSGLDNALPTPDMSPASLAPVAQAQLQWPNWGLHYETNGESGMLPDLPEAARLLELLHDWQSANTREDRERIWHAMLQIHADNVFTIGIVNGTKQPVASAPNLRNVPEAAVFAFEPGGYFGLYNPDTFWFERPKAPRKLKPETVLDRAAKRPERED